MAKRRGDRISELIKDVESSAKRLRADVRKRANATGLLKNLQTAAEQLRKRAAAAAGQVERYVHELRKELEGSAGQAARKAKSARRSASARKAAATRRRSAASSRKK
jgi:hypothetical protein